MNLTQQDLKKLETFAAPILKEAGRHIMSSWQNIHDVTLKDKRDVVTNVDVEVEEMIREKLAKLLPEAGFIVEEGKTEKKAEYNWVIDPIDGTKYYSHLTPMFVTQIALCKDDQSILGQIFNPVSDQFFSASLGNGTYLNGKRIIAKPNDSPDKVIVNLDFGGPDNIIDWKINIFKTFAKKFYRVRIIGGALPPYMLTGAFDAYVCIDPKNKIVDIAPNLIILSEGGLTHKNLLIDGNKFFISAHPRIVDMIEDFIIKAKK